jgi:phosphoglycerate kinase
MARKLIAEQREGTIVLLENLARDPREASGDEALSHALLRGVDLYVGDCLDAPSGFASLSSLPRLCKDRTLGIAVERELTAADQLNGTAASDLLIVLGGTFDAQASLRKWALRRGVTLAVVGPMATTLLAASGTSLGRTAIDEARLAEARTWLEQARREGAKVVLPSDFVVAGEHVTEQTLIREADGIGKAERVVDIGPDSVIAIGELATRAKSVLLAGEMGLGRRSTTATRDVLRLVAASGRFSVALHGRLDTHLLAPESETSPQLSFVSTSGGALVDILCARRIAVVETLRAVG